MILIVSCYGFTSTSIGVLHELRAAIRDKKTRMYFIGKNEF